MLATSADERRALVTPLPPHACSRIGTHTTATAFDLAVVTTGEALALAVATYMRTRCCRALNHRLSGSTHAASGLASASGPRAPVVLFSDPEEAARGGLGGSTKPAIGDLYRALEATACAYRHAAWQAERSSLALQASLATPGPTGRALAMDALAALQLSHSSRSTSLSTFENLLAVWLAHSLVDPSLQLNAPSLGRMERHPHMRSLFEESDFCAALLRHLKILAAGDGTA